MVIVKSPEEASKTLMPISIISENSTSPTEML